MAKKVPIQQEAIPLSDMRLYQVSLVVAIPDYGSGSEFCALDYIVPSLDGEVQVLSMTEVELLVIAATTATTATTATQVAVKAQVVTNTVPDDDDAFDLATLFVEGGAHMASGDIVEPTAKDKQYAAEREAKAKHPATGKKPKKHKKAYKPRSEDVIMRIEKVFATLQVLGYANATELAMVTNINVKQVYTSLYALHDAKKISASKKAGLVRWSANI